MDEDVRKALARWPDVPAAYGWLSLDPRGTWRFHPGGHANAGGPGEPIGNTQIQAFIGRNYTHDDQGRWFFQNGPQRVYLRIDAAPWILRYAADLALVTHTGSPFGPLKQWVLDDTGRLFVQSDMGAGMIDDRDLAGVCEAMQLGDGQAAIETLAALTVGQTIEVRLQPDGALIELACSAAGRVADTLGFLRQPSADGQPADVKAALR